MNAVRVKLNVTAKASAVGSHSWALVAYAAFSLAATTWSLQSPFKGYDLFTDDFFYYAQIARNIASGGGSTFNGLVDTNGYHPLWTFWLTVLWAASGDSQEIFAALVLTTIFASGLGTYFATILYLKSFGREFRVPAIADAAAVAVSAASLYLNISGMETTFAIPAAMFFLAFASRLRHRQGSSHYGLMFVVFLWGSIAVLSRLDLVFLVAVVGAYVILRRPLSDASSLLKTASVIGSAASPLIAYFASNVVIFGSVLPVSGAAKQMRTSHGFDPATLKSLLDPRDVPAKSFVWALSLFVVLGLIVAVVRRKARPNGTVIPILGATFPLVYYSILSFTSDWPVWPWYRYALVIGAAAILPEISLPGVVNNLHRALTTRLGRYSFAGALVVALLFLTWTTHIFRNYPNNSHYGLADDLNRQFFNSHPGIYAMGDAAGSVGFVNHNPVVQLEGLVMDKAYLQRLKTSTLGEILSYYNAAYYITANPVRRGGCWWVREPYQAGTSSISISQTICTPAMFDEELGGYRIAIFNARDIVLSSDKAQK